MHSKITPGTSICQAENEFSLDKLVKNLADATDSDSDQERLQEAFERYGTIRLIPFLL